MPGRTTAGPHTCSLSREGEEGGFPVKHSADLMEVLPGQGSEPSWSSESGLSCCPSVCPMSQDFRAMRLSGTWSLPTSHLHSWDEF